jgi:hypothetical protein
MSRYFQWFDGHPFQFSRQESLANLSGTEYYGWACNTDGSRVFFAYNGLNAAVGGNQISITKILSPAVGGTTYDQATVGVLTCGTNTLTGDNFSGGGDSNLPTTGVNGTWVYSNTIDAGAVILQANSSGVVYSRSFMLASMAGVFAHGKVKMGEIEQNFDYDFVMGKGFQMIFGTGICKDPLGIPNGYILVEHAIDVVGYPCPSYEA